MARSIRIEYAGAFYHVMARGNRREAIFHDEQDRLFFLKTLGEACAMTGWGVHAWVLMSNHYHLLIETPEPNLVEGMKWLQNSVTRRYNVRHRAWGRLFGDRYKAIVVEGEERFYYESLVDYIHLNPVRAGLVRPSQHQSVLDFEWSSLAKGYALAPRQRPPWLAAGAGLEMFGLQDTTAGRRRMVERLERRAVEEEGERCGVPLLAAEADARCSHLRRGWYWGSQAFAEKMVRLAEKDLSQVKSRAGRGAKLVQAHGLQQAEEWFERGLAAADLRKEDLGCLAGNDPRKVALAKLLWSRTTVSQGWIAGRLEMKSAANAGQLIRRGKEKQLHRRLSPKMRTFLNANGCPELSKT